MPYQVLNMSTNEDLRVSLTLYENSTTYIPASFVVNGVTVKKNGTLIGIDSLTVINNGYFAYSKTFSFITCQISSASTVAVVCS